MESDKVELVSALKSGDLSAAQQAYTQFQSDIGTGSSSGATTASSSNPFQSMMSQIGNALQSNDVLGAQQALSTFQNQRASTATGSNAEAGGPSALMDAVFSALSQAGVTGSTANSSAPPSSATPSSSGQDPLQALGAFMHNLFASLQSQGGQAATPSAQPPAQGGGDADGDHDGSAAASVSAPSGGHHHHHGGGGASQIESNLQSLIQQVSASAPGTAATSSSGAIAASPIASTSSTLQQSYQNLLSALGVSGSSSSLSSFLQALSQNLQGMSSSGNVVNTQA